MFYSQQILTKKGPLAKVWLAAHVHTKLTKAMALSTNVQSAVSRIISPDAPMALRLTSQLLLGVVRIFSRKTKYLLTDSSDALARLKLAYTPASSNDLADPHANPAAITLAGGGEASARGVNSVTTSARKALDMGGLSMPDLDFPEANSAGGATPKYLADAKDITIDEYSSGGMNSFGRDPDLDLLPVDIDVERDRMGMDYDEAPLMFTPSQERTPSTPQKNAASEPGGSKDGVSSRGESIERMRDAAVPGDGPATPRISLAFEDEADGVAKGSDAGLTPGVANEVATGETPLKPATPSVGADSDGVAPRDSLPLVSPDVATAGDANEPGDALLPTGDLVLADEGGDVESGKGETVNEEGQTEDRAEDEGAEGNELGDAAPKDREADAPGSLAAAAARDAARKRKGSGATVWDEETELSAQFVYDTLQDTSDLVRPLKRGRFGTGNASRARTAKDAFGEPGVPGLAPELRDFFSTVVFDEDRIWREPTSPITAEVDPRSGSGEEAESRGYPDKEEVGGKPSVSEPEHEDGIAASTERGDLERRGTDEGMVASGVEDGHREGPDGLEEAQGSARPPSIPDAEVRVSIGDSMVGDVDAGMMHSPVPMPEPSVDRDVRTPLGDGDGEDPAQPVASPAAPGALSLAEVAHTPVVVEDGQAQALGEAMISQRSVKMHQLLEDRAGGKEGQVSFSTLLKEAEVNRRVAARSFYELLNLCGKQMVALKQDEPYGEIVVNLASNPNQ